MLEELRIQNLGVIADATLPLASGLTCITGETGAGKTMVVAGLGLLFGGRASRAPLGADRALVEGRFAVGEAALELRERAIEAGADLEDGELLLARSVSSEGRSKAWVGGRGAPVGVLAELGELAISVHGQADQMRLLQPAEQRAALDRFAGADHGKILDAYRAVYTELGACTAELSRLRTSAREMAREADMLRLGVDEIAAVDPQEGEDAELAEEARRLENAEALRLAAATAHGAITGDPTTGDGGATDIVGAAARALEHDAHSDPKLAEFAERLAEAGALLAEAAVDLSSYLDDLAADPQRLEEIYQRQAALKTLYRKYAEDLPGVLAWAQNAQKRLVELDVSDERVVELESQHAELTARAAELAAQLRASRRAAAERFSAAVSAELKNLAMPHAEVSAAVEPRPAGRGGLDLAVETAVSGATEDGADEVELLLRPHPGSQPAALHKGASGGELSRVMLAIEVVFAEIGGPPVLVFDEVDAGVGGRAAVEIGRCLAKLARRHQVLVVTHLPQVAAFADRHLVVSKDTSGAVTVSGVRVVDDAERARELARMLAGMPDSHLGVAHAEELLAEAAKMKA
ncbi:DNA repair protein RecN [Glycomyces sp. TRM65418]|uniref:DNA repair protein RecN n=1 Tax=Glycomyces sp. TRM65418 TaxID=2867006 RepID=UPI001CE6CCE3|nr:DNA repair protein RecN [Glycomyces sp. TRM65418]MCC3761539.1 DNA repair protein RecN [Glycomyces sp. TRM65418]QZD55635.1 DNA repair protein RecN [Glycomyces sp. TRM65418]